MAKPCPCRFALALALVGACSRAPAPQCAPDFRYDAHAVDVEWPDLAMVRLGEQVRIWSAVDRWTPATVTLRDAAGAALHSIRVDLPPRGAITGGLPSIVGVHRIELAVAQYDRAMPVVAHQPLVGVAEPQLTMDRLSASGWTPWRRSEQAGDSFKASGGAPGVSVSHHSHDPGFAATHRLAFVVGPAFPMVARGVEGTSAAPATEAGWRSEPVRAAVAGLRESNRKRADGPR